MDIEWLLPKNIFEFSVILLSILALDVIYPKHTGILYRIHPVHTAYEMSLSLYRKFPKTRVAGVIIWFIVVSTHTIIYTLILYMLSKIHRILWLVFSVYILKTSTSIKLLVDHVTDVYHCLRRENLMCAREAVSNIVRRDVKNLGEGHVASAAIESLFENIVDSFTSPLLYFLVLGPIGALIQRIANALDAALGYKHEPFKYVGWFSAKMDTILNFVPARLTAFLLIALCPLAKGSIKKSLAIYLRDKGNTESVNSGHPLSAASGCLSIKLEKLGSYTIGKEYCLPTHVDIAKALKLAIYITTFYIVLLHILFIIMHSI